MLAHKTGGIGQLEEGKDPARSKPSIHVRTVAVKGFTHLDPCAHVPARCLSTEAASFLDEGWWWRWLVEDVDEAA